MGLFGWLTRRSADTRDPRLTGWRRAWAAAAADGLEVSIQSLAADLDAMRLADDEIEIEREMLDGLRDLVRLRGALELEGLPVVETGHRVIGADRCHFSTPVSMPDESAQPSGRLLLTSSRAIFVGGGRTSTVAWHLVGEALQQDRDVVLVRKDRETALRFRCNTFSDAMCGAFLSRRLAATRVPGASPARTRT